MKLLLDENLPHDLRHFVSGHECFTVAYMGWAGIKNGALLALAAGSGFDALLTHDSGIEFQQNLSNIPLAVVVLKSSSNTLDDLRPLVPALLELLATLAPRTVTRVQLP